MNKQYMFFSCNFKSRDSILFYLFFISHWNLLQFPSLCSYDRQKLTLKEIHNTQYVACMNPTAGTFIINPRLQVW